MSQRKMGVVASTAAATLLVMAASTAFGAEQCHEKNSCKGKGSCSGTAAGAEHTCKGQNACKGNVRTDIKDKAACEKIKGTWK